MLAGALRCRGCLPTLGQVVASALLLSCGDAPLQLIVELRTDFVPGIEFTTTRTTIAGNPEAIEFEVSRGPVSLESLRVAEFNDLTVGSREVTVELLDSRGGWLAEGTVLAQQDTSTAVAVLVPRSCGGVRCPEGETCLSRTCQSLECASAPETCVEPECGDATECTEAASCARASCLDGVCVYEASDVACPDGSYCHPEAGCLGVPEGSQYRVSADLTGNGYADLVVHSQGLRLYEGGPDFSPTGPTDSQSHLVAPEGCWASGHTQRADVNGDGRADLLAVYGCMGVRRLAVVTGPIPSGTLSLDSAWRTVELVGVGSNGPMGIADLSGDGEPDFFMVVPEATNRDGTSTGQIWVYFGLVDLVEASAPDVIIEGSEEGEGFAARVNHRPGDVTGDGLPDLAIGAAQSSINGARAGAVYLFEGPLAPGTHRARELASTILVGRHRSSLAGTGVAYWDANLDGQLDLVVGADEDNAGGSFAGRASVFFGPVPAGQHALDEADAHVTGYTRAEIGTGLDADTDLDGDDRPDLLIWGCCTYTPLANAGSLAAVYASVDFASIALRDVPFLNLGEEAEGLWGFPTSVGDLDGDGFDDFTASHWRRNGEDGGLHVYLGGVSQSRGGPSEFASLFMPGIPGVMERFGILVGRR